MTNLILQHEGSIRLFVFATILLLMMGLETWQPRKTRTQSRMKRWPTNALLIVIDSIFVRLLFPMIAVGVAIWAREHQWGLFNLVTLPPLLEFLIAIIILDMMIYWQHVASHHIPFLWALHKVHHVDRDIDVTTGSRFHPIEIGLSMIYKMLVVLFLGAPAIAVILFEIILNACAMFHHSNVKLPIGLDNLLRKFIVTPDMHRVHHSIIVRETNSNYGFSVPWWDQIFGSYISQPSQGHDKMIIGLKEHQNDKPSSLLWSLWFVFRAD